MDYLNTYVDDAIDIPGSIAYLITCRVINPFPDPINTHCLTTKKTYGINTSVGFSHKLYCIAEENLCRRVVLRDLNCVAVGRKVIFGVRSNDI